MFIHNFIQSKNYFIEKKSLNTVFQEFIKYFWGMKRVAMKKTSNLIHTVIEESGNVGALQTNS